MVASFKELKAQKQNSLAKLKEEFKKLQAKTYESDERFWYPNVDNSGNGRAVIRFLPAPAGEDVPYVVEYKHSFKGPTGLYYIENCLSTIGQEDPVNVFNKKLWASGNKKDEEQARQQKRKKSFIANVLIIKDPLNPENEGQVRLFRFGQKIWDKLNELMNPQFNDDPQINPFCPWEGATFEIRIATVDKYRNYDKSKFHAPEPLGDDEFIESTWKQTHPLQPFVDPNNTDLFKPYKTLEQKLYRVLGLDGSKGPAPRSTEDAVEEEEVTDLPWKNDKAAPEPSIPEEDASDNKAELDWLKQLAEQSD